MTPTLEQMAAIQAIDSFCAYARAGEHLTVEAPAGTGKTTLIVEVCKRMALAPRVITFTRRAAAELRARGVVDATTIYALAAERMRPQDLARVVTEDIETIIYRRWCGVHRADPKTSRALFRAQGPRLLTTTAMLSWLPQEYRPWIVDEAQDCTAAEIEAIERCAQGVVWVGDPWQRIYEWRETKMTGKPSPCAIPWAGAIRLEENHRSDVNIVARAAEVSTRPERTVGCAAPNGLTAWLCRSNRDAEAIAKAIGCHLVAGPDREVLAQLQIEAAAELGCDWAQAYRRAPSWEMATQALAWALDGVDTWSPRAFLIWLRTHDLQDAVTDHPVQAMTIHAAKGLQFEEVNLVGWPMKTEEDQRLLYTAVTRPTHRLREYRDLEAALIACREVRRKEALQ